ncbi:MAG TPA: glycosyltransferase family 4 protein [Candidatus Saccharimonadales bacterium]|nr:glycosyltransferase family 4 protein [Candidatus Saccharimonadales bacterium]
MKIGIVCPYNIFKGGGVQEYALGLRNSLVANGHKAFVITPQPMDYDGPKVPGIIMIGGAAPIRSFHTSAQVSASVDTDALEAVLREQNFDILHFHEPWVPMLSRQILSRSDAIHIATFHAAMSERWTARTLERVITPYTKSILKYLDVLTAVSPVATNYIKTLTHRKIYIIPNAIDIEKYQQKDKQAANPQKNKKTILYVGRLEKRKAVKYLIQAFGAINQVHKRYHLIIAGEGPDRDRLEEQIKESDINNVTFLGHIDEAEKINLLQSCDVFCSPAMYGESFGIVLLEAMAAGCVTVAGANAGYESVLTGSGQISLVNPKDTKDFARRLLLMASDDGLRQHWLGWAENEVSKYSYQNIVNQYMKLYELAYTKKHHE